MLLTSLHLAVTSRLPYMYGGAKSVAARRWCRARLLLHQPRRAVVAHRTPARPAAAARPHRQRPEPRGPSHAAGISTYTYQKFEKGESRPSTPMNPRLRTLIALATALDMQVEELVGGVADTEPGRM